MLARNMPPFRYLVLWAFTVAAVVYILAPLVVVTLNSFSSVAYNVFPPEGYSLRWYKNLMSQDVFYAAALRSVVLALLATALSLAIGVAAAYALVRYRPVGTEFLNAIFLSPLVLPKMVLGVAVFILVVRVGLYGNYISLLLTHVLVCVPFVIAVVTAALVGFDWTIQEAAFDLGAGPLRTFFKVILPQIWISVFIAGLLSFVTSFDQVETTMFLTRPGQSTLPIEMFLYFQRWQDPTIAALSSLLICFAALLLVLFSIVTAKRKLPVFAPPNDKG